MSVLERSKVMLVIYIIWIIVIFITSIGDYENIAVTPKQVYECTNLNMFACTLVTIIGFLLDPLFYIVHFISWLLHVGRKE